jgi:tRNA(Ile)-lysidine synthase
MTEGSGRLFHPLRAVSAEEFAARMARLGPFEPGPQVAIAVSGGADSMALALLGSAWAQGKGGTAVGFIVDHGIRPESAQEASCVAGWLAQLGLSARILRLSGLAKGSGLAERAREARYAALVAACREAGMLHLLLGHHAGDQAETVMMRALSGSGAAGLAGMAALVELASVRLLRPLLDISPRRLRAMLRQAGVAWVEDPSNQDRTVLRTRLRAALRDAERSGPAVAELVETARRAGAMRAEEERRIAAELAEKAEFYAEGFALLCAARMSLGALSTVLRMVSGGWLPPAPGVVAALAGELRSATLAGARVIPAGALGRGWLVVREARPMGPAVPAVPGAVWDGRFQLGGEGEARGLLGAVGNDSRRLRHLSALPAAVLHTLPAIRVGDELRAVPHVGYPNAAECARFPVVFCPSIPAAGAQFKSL